MIINKVKNSKRNIIWATINMIIKIGCPFLVRTIIIYILGNNFIGLNTLFTSVLNLLSLSELGFDVAIVSIMYKEIANDNQEKIKSLLNYLKKVYLIVGVVILLVGAALIPTIPFLINDIDKVPPSINIYVVYSIYLLSTSFTYFFGGYRSCILNAYQRRDAISKASIIILLLTTSIQCLLLFLVKNYYAYVATLPLVSLLTSIFNVYFSKKLFPDINPEGQLNDEDKKTIKKTVYGTFMSKIGGVLTVSVDTIIASAFLGIEILGYYSNYTYIISAIVGIITIFSTSIQAGLGNLVNTSTVEHNTVVFKRFTFIMCWIVGFCSICFLYIFQPFINIWIGEKGVLPYFVVISLVASFYFANHDQILGTYKSVLSIWWEDRYRCLIGGIVNLGLNVLMVILLKPYGESYALLGLTAATIFQQIFILTPWATHVTFKKYFKEGEKKYYLSLFVYFLVTVGITCLMYPIFMYFPQGEGGFRYLFLILRILICIIVPNLLYLLIYFKTSVFKEAFNYTKSIIRRKR